jgi:4-diphosphocytidyl-2-C-methyl-D-erythritol kinase
MTHTALSLAAPAKLNLYLHVVGKRADNYHLLDGLVAFADIGDRLSITPADRLAFAADGPFAQDLGGDSAANLVVRAACDLAAAVGREAAFAFHLTKNLPVASGIGGGSADAAACLRGLARLWGLDPQGQEVLRVAARLGSDIPVCVAGRSCYIGGIGTDLAPAPTLPAVGLLLVNPGIGLPTPAVYRARHGGFSPPMRFGLDPADARELAACLALRGNDLTLAAIGIVPEIEAVLSAIAGVPGCLLSRMSGSGATCFGLFATEAAAAAGAAAIGADHPGWWVAPGRLLSDANSLDGPDPSSA